MFNRPAFGKVQWPQQPMRQQVKPMLPAQQVKPTVVTPRPSLSVNALRPVPIRRGF